jgi:hypothetical protein
MELRKERSRGMIEIWLGYAGRSQFSWTRNREFHARRDQLNWFAIRDSSTRNIHAYAWPDIKEQVSRPKLLNRDKSIGRDEPSPRPGPFS